MHFFKLLMLFQSFNHLRHIRSKRCHRLYVVLFRSSRPSIAPNLSTRTWILSFAPTQDARAHHFECRVAYFDDVLGQVVYYYTVGRGIKGTALSLPRDGCVGEPL